MPITQERMVQLVQAAQDCLDAWQNGMAEMQHIANNLIAGTIDGANANMQIQRVEMSYRPSIDTTMIIAREAEHFRVIGRDNERNRARMALRRQNQGVQPRPRPDIHLRGSERRHHPIAPGPFAPGLTPHERLQAALDVADVKSALAVFEQLNDEDLDQLDRKMLGTMMRLKADSMPTQAPVDQIIHEAKPARKFDLGDRVLSFDAEPGAEPGTPLLDNVQE